MPHCRAALISCARASVATPSQSSRPPQSTKMPDSCASILCWLIRRENGYPRNGRYAPLVTRPRRNEWAPRFTYARRYALFTLVGIAGEDDLDAPDLGAPRKPESGSPIEPNGQPEPRGDVATDHADARSQVSSAHPEDAARTRCIRRPAGATNCRELAAIATADEAVTWAQRCLPAKNTLTSADADVIEQAFRVKMHSVERIENDKATSPAPSGDQLDKFDTQPGLNAPKLDTGLPPDIVPSSDGPKLAPMEDDQNAIALTKPVRKRDKAHRDFVCSQPCLICGRRPSDAHHIRFGQPRALGRKVSDEFTVPLCRVHHRDLHRGSDEKKWWEAAKIEPMEIAQRLWRETRDNTA